jgi:uncharacterized protein YjiS (DUF1127 family)
MSMLQQAPAIAAAGKGKLLSEHGLAALRGLGRLVAAWRSRKLVMDMRDFDDAQLADIGLKRSDVERALQLPVSADPSMYLVRARDNPLGSLKRQ